MGWPARSRLGFSYVANTRRKPVKTRYFKIVPVAVMPTGNFRSAPAEIGSACPLVPVPAPRALHHPQQMTETVDTGFKPMVPGNDSTLAIKYPL